MSRGPGRLQTKIAECFDKLNAQMKSDAKWKNKAVYVIVDDLYDICYPNGAITKDHQKSIKRAAKEIASDKGWKLAEIKCGASRIAFLSPHLLENLGKKAVMYNLRNAAHKHLKYKVIPKIEYHNKIATKLQLSLAQLRKDATEFMYNKLAPNQIRNIIMEEINNYLKETLTEQRMNEILREAEFYMEQRISGLLKSVAKDRLKYKTHTYINFDPNYDAEDNDDKDRGIGE